MRESGGARAAWNGGTGVAPEFRRRGVGKALIEAALGVYREQRVEAATREALVSNGTAVSLYRSLGFEITDRLFLLERRGPLVADQFGGEGRHAVTRMSPREVARLGFYGDRSPWQSQWQSVQLSGGEGLVVSDGGGAAGYGLFQRSLDLLNLV